MRSKMKITRRRFFALAGGVLAAAAVPHQMWGASGFPVGIQLYMVNADLTKDPAGTLKKIAEIGYSEVETAGWGKLSAAQFRDLLRDAGLRAPSAIALPCCTPRTSRTLQSRSPRSFPLTGRYQRNSAAEALI